MFVCPKGTLIYSYFPNGKMNTVLGMEHHLKEYGGNLLKGPMLRSILHHLTEGNTLYLRHGPDEFSCDLIKCMVIND